ncbi:hypothetical protein PB01_08550 [Psychrobacillus glaciei]|uniref:Uncharacterized protein n=1 Tax=Psychrobacillus glaciei TaxID=2283160 RepID=A0A5J6SLW7_9BACI|nr:hypothetical protein PB01_08550 [Psychrobacillus glaciei]
MFKSEVTNKVINIIFSLAWISLFISRVQNGSKLITTLGISMCSVMILFDIYKIIKIKKLKVD